MRKPRKLDDFGWMNKSIAWIDLSETWSVYLRDVAIPRAYADARALRIEAGSRGDEERTLSAGFKVYALLVLARRTRSYRRLVAGRIRFPLTGADVLALTTRPEPVSVMNGKKATGFARALRRLSEDSAAKEASSEVSARAVAYCRDFLAWEMSAPRLGASRRCGRCGRCCTDLWDAYDFTAAERDILLWSLHGRWDIIERVEWGVWHCWLDPETGRPAASCPWLESKSGGTTFSCGIDAVKPKHCRVWRGCPEGKPGHSVDKVLYRARNKDCSHSSSGGNLLR